MAPIAALIEDRAPATLRELAIGLAGGWVLGFAFAIPAGRLRRAPVFDALSATSAGLLLSLPAALIAYLCVLAGAASSTVLVLVLAPRIFQFSKNLLRSAYDAAHVEVARARGIGETRIFWAHVLPSAGPQMIALAAASVSITIGAAIPIEAICDVPGIGKLAWERGDGSRSAAAGESDHAGGDRGDGVYRVVGSRREGGFMRVVRVAAIVFLAAVALAALTPELWRGASSRLSFAIRRMPRRRRSFHWERMRWDGTGWPGWRMGLSVADVGSGGGVVLLCGGGFTRRNGRMGGRVLKTTIISAADLFLSLPWLFLLLIVRASATAQRVAGRVR